MVADAVGQCYYQPLSPLSISVTIIASIRCRWFYWVVMVTYLWPPMSFAGYLYYHTTKGGQYRYLVYLSINLLTPISRLALWYRLHQALAHSWASFWTVIFIGDTDSDSNTCTILLCHGQLTLLHYHLNFIFEYVVMISPNSSPLRLNTLITSPIQWIVLEMRVGGNSSMGLDQASITLRKSCSSCTISHSD